MLNHPDNRALGRADVRIGKMFAVSTELCPGVVAADAWASATNALNRSIREARLL